MIFLRKNNILYANFLNDWSKFVLNSIKLFSEKKSKEKISMITCYDYSTAAILNGTKIDSILVGDSLGMVFQGNESTLSVTVEEMIYHTKAVKKGAKDKFVITDMPFLSYQISPEDAVRNAGKIIKESNAEAVKLEGGEEIIGEVKALIKAKIPVMGHLGLTPQSVNVFGGYKVQGKSIEDARNIVKDALLLQDAGVFSIVLECVPYKLAKLITEKLDIPTIGIGAGKYTDGQVLVINDLLGMFEEIKPKFVKKYSNIGAVISESINNYIDEVNQSVFPSESQSFSISDEVIDILKGEF